MSHQVLARKYRPTNFSTLMGQEHVSQALSNALASDRLHHAYLFSGTRGVGKTTIARILAKSLNCEQGIVKEPCGVCDCCVEINEGRHIDLIEVDAASKTKVEDPRELLENIQYGPARGRFKIYLIDEVHMLSNHSFNALLKTLEEPPAHVKFLLATTDPQKLPVTVLSRCLKFNLKRLTVKQIVQQLEYILQQEKIEYQSAGLSSLATAADGSMRDALSLLDQAISYDAKQIQLSTIDDMLGNIATRQMDELLLALFEKNASALISKLHEVLDLGIEARTVLSEVISQLQQLAMLQFVPEITQERSPLLSPLLQQIVDKVAQEDVQLFYQIALNGYNDLQISPLANAALEMTFLRMLTFAPMGEIKLQLSEVEPVVVEPVTAENIVATAANIEKKNSLTEQASTLLIPSVENHPLEIENELQELSRERYTDNSEIEASQQQAERIVTAHVSNVPESNVPESNVPESNVPESKPAENMVNEIVASENNPIENNSVENNATENNATENNATENNATENTEEIISPILFTEEGLKQDSWPQYWQQLIAQLPSNEFENELLHHCFIDSFIESFNADQKLLILRIGYDQQHEHLFDSKCQQLILTLLKNYFQQSKQYANISVAFVDKIDEKKQETTPRRLDNSYKEQQQEFAEKSIYQDERLKELIQTFSATIIHASIKPIAQND